MNGYSYQEKDLLGGWKIEVKKGRSHIGNIRKNPRTGDYQYYNGPDNVLNYSFEEKDLNELKKKIERRS